MAPKYKLIYFDAKARGEVSRLLFAAAGVQFEDVRVDFQKDWPAMKPNDDNDVIINDANIQDREFAIHCPVESRCNGVSWNRSVYERRTITTVSILEGLLALWFISETPQGALPVLEVDGGKLVLSQSGAISRYLARTFKLYGKNEDEAAIIDVIYDTIMDLFPKRAVLIFEQDETKKATLKKELEEEHIPRFLNILEPVLSKYGKDGFAVGKSLTLADAVLFVGLEFTTAVPILNANKDKYRSLLRNRETFEKIPKIKAWLDKRPDNNI